MGLANENSIAKRERPEQAMLIPALVELIFRDADDQLALSLIIPCGPRQTS